MNATPIPQPNVTRGRTTFYDADGSGNCSFPKSPNNLDVVALNKPQYGSADLCGACLEVTGPKGTITVRVVDSCPECPEGALDLSASAFAKLEAPVKGVFTSNWKVVRCPNVAPVISYHLKDGSSRFWTAIQVRDHSVPIAKLEIEKNGAFINAPRQSYNYFVLSSGSGTDGPFRVRVTASTGASRIDTIPSPASDKLYAGQGNF
jgi:expansin